MFFLKIAREYHKLVLVFPKLLEASSMKGVELADIIGVDKFTYYKKKKNNSFTNQERLTILENLDLNSIAKKLILK